MGLTADSTVFLDASLVGKTVAAPPGRPTAIAPNQEVMAIDKTALVPLVFWLQGVADCRCSTGVGPRPMGQLADLGRCRSRHFRPSSGELRARRSRCCRTCCNSPLVVPT